MYAGSTTDIKGDLILSFSIRYEIIVLRHKTTRRTWRSTDAAEVTGDEDDDGQQRPQGGGAKAGPQDRPPGLRRCSSCAERRHGAVAVARSETNTIRVGLHSTGVGTLEKHGGKKNSMKVSCSE